MSLVDNNQIRYRILEELYKYEQKEPGRLGVENEAMLGTLGATSEQMDFNMLYLEEKGLVELLKVMGSLWRNVRITALGIDVVENKERYMNDFPFIQAVIQQIQGPIYGTVVQAVSSQVNFSQQVANAFQEAQRLTNEQSIAKELKTEITENLEALKREIVSGQPDAGQIQRPWNWLKRNASWVVPTLTQIVVEGLRRVVV